MAYFLYTLSVFLACGVLEDCEAYFFCGSKKYVEAGLGALRCAGAELLGDFYFEKIKILLPKNASDEKIFLRFEKIFWG